MLFRSKPDPSLWFRLRLLDSCYQSFGSEALKKWNWLNARISQFAPLHVDLNWSNHSSDTLLQVQSQIFRKNPQDAAWNLIESGSIQRYLDQPDSLSLLAGELHYKVLNLSANPQVSDSVWSQAIQVEPEGFFLFQMPFAPKASMLYGARFLILYLQGIILCKYLIVPEHVFLKHNSLTRAGTGILPVQGNTFIE